MCSVDCGTYLEVFQHISWNSVIRKDKLVYQRNAVLSLPIYGYNWLLVFILFNHSICILELLGLLVQTIGGTKPYWDPVIKPPKVYTCIVTILCHANSFAEFCYRSFALIMHICTAFVSLFFCLDYAYLHSICANDGLLSLNRFVSRISYDFCN